MSAHVVQGDCRWYMGRMGFQVDAIVTDSPYELGFMGKTWDSAGVAYDYRTWRLAHQVLKPGGRLLAFGAPRTHHRIWCAIEDAGFVIEDTVAWMFGTGFPKHSSKLKPMWEPVCVARKGPVTALNVDAGRIAHGEECKVLPAQAPRDRFFGQGDRRNPMLELKPEGRWPPNVAMDEIAAEMLDAQTGTLASGNHPAKRRGIGFTESAGGENAGTRGDRRSTDSGGASRFLYVAKASRAEREQGLWGTPSSSRGFAHKRCRTCGRQEVNMPGSECQCDKPDWATATKVAPVLNGHPTVKPVALMRWLVKLVTQPGDLVLDPFAGSGTTGMACVLEGRKFIGIEREPEYAAIAERRIANALGPLFVDVARGSGGAA